MIDLHMHTIWSDGELVPAEMTRRARARGVRALALTDHVDQSNVEVVVPALVKFVAETKRYMDVIVLPGMEITHAPPQTIAALAKRGRQLGAKWIVVHGETVVEPVPPGTNLAAIKARVDLLAHPGLITEEEVRLAAKNNVTLEITARKGHSLSNGRLAAMARKLGAAMILNTDSHSPGDLIDEAFARTVALGAGLSSRDFGHMLARSEELVKKALKRKAQK